MDFLKKNKMIVGGIVVIIVGLLGVWYFVLPKGTTTNQPIAEEPVAKEIKPEDIGLTVSLTPDNRSVEMEITKLDGIKTIDYELSYDAEETNEGETAVVLKGVGGTFDVDGKSTLTRTILLGTESARTKRYDKVKSDIKVVLNVVYENGERGAVETTLSYTPEE